MAEGLRENGLMPFILAYNFNAIPRVLQHQSRPHRKKLLGSFSGIERHICAHNSNATPHSLRHQSRPHRRESNGSLVEIEWRRELGL